MRTTAARPEAIIAPAPDPNLTLGKVLERRPVFHGRVVDLAVERVELPNGEVCELELIRHPGAAAVLPLTATGEVVLVRQYRHATGGWLLEVPAGKLDPDEAPEACARRELEEEVGWRAGRLEPLGWIWSSPGFADERIWLFLATELELAAQSLEADELLHVELLPFEQAVALASEGQIVDCKTVCCLLRAHLRPSSLLPPEKDRSEKGRIVAPGEPR